MARLKILSAVRMPVKPRQVTRTGEPLLFAQADNENTRLALDAFVFNFRAENVRGTVEKPDTRTRGITLFTMNRAYWEMVAINSIRTFMAAGGLSLHALYHIQGAFAQVVENSSSSLEFKSLTAQKVIPACDQ